ncbi:MAG: hypothetical protein ACHQK9_09400 [Reyranellales bacterium]
MSRHTSHFDDDIRPQDYDRYGNFLFKPLSPVGHGVGLLIGVLAILGVLGGLMLFNASPLGGTDTARVPPPTVSIPAK